MQNDTPGFSLIETLIATTIVIVAFAGLAQMFVIATAANNGSKARTVATILAQDKMEELLALEGEVEAGADFIGARGQLLGAGVLPPLGTAYVRHWSVAPLPDNPEAAVVLYVWVSASRDPSVTTRLEAVKARRVL